MISSSYGIVLQGGYLHRIELSSRVGIFIAFNTTVVKHKERQHTRVKNHYNYLTHFPLPKQFTLPCMRAVSVFLLCKCFRTQCMCIHCSRGPGVASYRHLILFLGKWLAIKVSGPVYMTKIRPGLANQGLSISPVMITNPLI